MPKEGVPDKFVSELNPDVHIADILRSVPRRNVIVLPSHDFTFHVCIFDKHTKCFLIFGPAPAECKNPLSGKLIGYTVAKHGKTIKTFGDTDGFTIEASSSNFKIPEIPGRDSH